MYKRYIITPILIALVLGCSQKQPNPFPTPAPKPNDGAYTSRLDSIMIGPTKHAIEYGTLTVRENRDVDNSCYIHLPVKRIRSSSADPLGPVFYFAGGPGRSNMHNIGAMGYLLPKHDIVLVGFRGVDGSSVLACPQVKKAMQGKGELFSPASIENISRAWQADARALQDRGVDLDGYTMPDVIEDMELARQALGYNVINLKSASYGTRVAQLYAQIHPASINRSLMVAVNPPGHFVWEPDVLDQQLHQYAELWARFSPNSAQTPDLYATITDVLHNMPSHWLLLPIDTGKVKCVAFCLCFQNTTAAMVFDAFLAAGRGDYSGLALMSLAYDYVLPGMFTWGDLASKAVSADYDPNRNYLQDMQPSGMPMGSPMSVLLWGPLQSADTWPIRSIPDEYKIPQPTDVPTLLVSGRIDVGTPTQAATNELLPVLKNGRQVIIAESGHMDIEWSQPEHFQRMAISFYATGEPDTSLGVYKPMDFTVKWGFPRIAKVALTGIAVILLLLAGLVLVIIRTVKIIRAKY